VPTNNFESLKPKTKYLELHLDRRLSWRKHVFTKRKQLEIQLGKMYWLLGSKSQLSTENKLLLYKAIWNYGVQVWASNSNIEILQKFQKDTSESLSMLFDTLPMTFYIMVSALETRLKDSTDIRRYEDEEYPNVLATLMTEIKTTRQLKRKLPQN